MHMNWLSKLLASTVRCQSLRLYICTVSVVRDPHLGSSSVWRDSNVYVHLQYIPSDSNSNAVAIVSDLPPSE